MDKTIIKAGKIITVNKDSEIITDGLIVVEDGIIKGIHSDQAIELNVDDYEVVDASKKVLVPGFIQTHVHLCQTIFRGLADDLELLDWLQKRIFPYENAHSEESLRLSTALGIYELQTSGTTTILDMGTINHQSIIFDELINSGIRAFSGKCMVDQNELYSIFKESTDKSLTSTYELAKEFHNSSTGKVKYGFAPRFVLSCTERLLKETFSMMKDFNGSLYHTHSSENKSEIETVRRTTGKENIEYFDSIGVLGSDTVLAHCVHLNETEIELMKNSETSIAHCPSSNLKLGSGIANIPRYLKDNIQVSLGNDGPPCNNSFSAFSEMRAAALIQKPIHGSTSMDAETTFRLATIEGAKVLNLEDEIGSIEIGKKADLVVLDLNQPGQCLLDNNENLYSSIVYSATRQNVTDVIIEGEWVVKNSESTKYDKKEIFAKGKNELEKLLKRVEIN